MPYLADFRPLDEACLYDDRGAQQVGAQAWEHNRLGERRLRNFEGFQPRTQFQQQLGIESGAKLAGVNQIVVLEVSHQKGAQSLSNPLWVGEAADYKLLR